jgi:hypothetical protein
MAKFDAIFGLLGPALVLCVVVVFIRRRLYREFPFFFGYLWVVIAVSALRFWAIADYPLYFKVFWATEVLYAAVTLLVLNEVFRYIFSEFYEIWWWFRLIFPAAALSLVTFKVAGALLHPTAQAPPLAPLAISFGLAVSWVEAALFGLICLLVWMVGVWEYYPVGIVSGFAIAALGSWAGYAARSVFGTKSNIPVKYLPPLAYFCAVLVWLVTFLRTPRPERWEQWKQKITPEQMLAELKEYLRILKGKRSQ